MASKRITIMIDEKNYSKIHKIQAKRILNENRAVSFSQVINDQLEKSF